MARHHVNRTGRCALAVIAILAGLGRPAWGQDAQREIDALKQQIEELRRREAETKQKLDALERQLNAVQTQQETAKQTAAASALDQAVEELEVPRVASADLWSRQVGGANVRLIDISFDILAAAGTSTATDSELADLEGGAHDPNQRGFTLQHGELALFGAVDPYFTAFGDIVFTPTSVELEEAYFTTLQLPLDLQFKGGYSFTEFGIINPQHPHSWDWLDQPVINTRLFGGEGLRTTGGRLSWLTPLPWYATIDGGVYNAGSGETTTSFFADEGVGGRPAVFDNVSDLGDLLYFLRIANSWELPNEWTAVLGFSGLHGPNSTGTNAQTWIYGTDLKLRWVPANNFRGWPFFLWQTEVDKRDYTADWFIAGTDMAGGGNGHTHGDESEPTEEDEFPNDLPSEIMRDYGLYTQALYGFHYRWAGGIRFEYASGHGKSVMDGELVSREQDPFRSDRYRVSPLLVFHPTEFSRFRLQFNYDNAKYLPDPNKYTVWVGAEVMFGAHAAHRY